MSEQVGWSGWDPKDFDSIEGPRKAVLLLSSAALVLLAIHKWKKRKRRS